MVLAQNRNPEELGDRVARSSPVPRTVPTNQRMITTPDVVEPVSVPRTDRRRRDSLADDRGGAVNTMILRSEP